MKKLLIAALAVVTLSLAVPTTASAEQAHQGGILGGLVGCCFGLRTASDYNDGKDVSIREWLRLIPFVNIVVAVLDTVDGYNGVSRSQLHAEQPSYF